MSGFSGEDIKFRIGDLDLGLFCGVFGKVKALEFG